MLYQDVTVQPHRILTELNFIKKREEKIGWFMGYLGQVYNAIIIPKNKNGGLKYSQSQNDYPQIRNRLGLSRGVRIGRRDFRLMALLCVPSALCVKIFSANV